MTSNTGAKAMMAARTWLFAEQLVETSDTQPEKTLSCRLNAEHISRYCSSAKNSEWVGVWPGTASYSNVLGRCVLILTDALEITSSKRSLRVKKA